MQGYLTPCIPELKIKDYKMYHAFRCGIVQELRKNYGFLPRMLMNKDVVLVALLCDGLSGRQGTIRRSFWGNVLFQTRFCIFQTMGVRQAAQINVLTLWYDVLNKIKKSNKPLTKLYWKICKILLTRAYKKAVSCEGATINRLLKQAIAHKNATTEAKITDYNVAMEYSSSIYSEILLFCAPDNASVKYLHRTGYYLGRIFYLLHTIKNYNNDKKHGYYNVFIENGLNREMAIASAKRQCHLALSEMTKSYALLDLKCNRTLLDNIVYHGLEITIENIGK